jgi:hypothetical protein
MPSERDKVKSWQFGLRQGLLWTALLAVGCALLPWPLTPFGVLWLTGSVGGIIGFLGGRDVEGIVAGVTVALFLLLFTVAVVLVIFAPRNI